MSARLVPLARLAPLFRFVLALAIVAAVSVGVVRPLLSWAAPASTPEPAPSTGATADLAAILPRAADFEAAGLPSFRSAGGRWLDHGARRDQPAGSEWRAGPATTAFLAAYELAWASAGTNPPRESTTIRTSATQFADDASAGSALNLLAPDGAPREIAGADEALLSNGPSGTAAATTLTVRMGATLLAVEVAPEPDSPLLGDEALVADVLVRPTINRLVAMGAPPPTGLAPRTPRLAGSDATTVRDGYVMLDGEGFEMAAGESREHRSRAIAAWRGQGIVSWYRVDQVLPGPGGLSAETIRFDTEAQASASGASLVPASAQQVELPGDTDPVAAWITVWPDTGTPTVTALWLDGDVVSQISIAGPTRETALAAMGELAAGTIACQAAGNCSPVLPVPAALIPAGTPAPPAPATGTAAPPAPGY